MEYIRNNTVTLMLFLIIPIILLSICSVNAADFNINNNTSGGLNGTISGAGNNDVIHLDPGKYRGPNNTNLTISKNLTIIGNGPKESVVIDGESTNWIFQIMPGYTFTLINITLQNGYNSNGGAIHNEGKLTIQNCQLQNNYAVAGGAIYSQGIDSSLSIDRSVINNNHADYAGAGVYNSQGNISANNSIFANNTVYNVGAGIANDGDYNEFIVNNCTFIDNYAPYGGSGIGNSYGHLTIKKSTFRNNNADYGGGAVGSYGENLTILNSTFTNNTSNSDAGAVGNIGDNFKVINSTFNNNSVVNSGGGAIGSSGNNFTIINSTFNNNIGGDYYGGGAVGNEGDNFTVVNSSFNNNTAGEYAGGAIGNQGHYFTVLNSTFKNNQAIQKGAIANIGENLTVINSIFINNTAEEYGAAIGAASDNVTIINSTFINNTAPTGGAIYILIGENFTVINSNFIGNNRAIILNCNSSIIKDCNFTKNELAIFANGTNFTISGCNIINNTQGILLNSTTTNAIINYNRIFNNTNATGYDLDNYGSNTNANYNWWGSNKPLVNGIELDNYFVMSITNATPLKSKGNVTFNYVFKLNTNDSFDSSLLPYFSTSVYTNATNRAIANFDARFSRLVETNIKTNGDLTYTFITDNEVQSLNGTITNPTPKPNPKPEPNPKPNPKPTPNPNDNHTNQTPNVKKANASMKSTGIPIIPALLILLSSIGLIARKKE